MYQPKRRANYMQNEHPHVEVANARIPSEHSKGSCLSLNARVPSNNPKQVPMNVPTPRNTPEVSQSFASAQHGGKIHREKAATVRPSNVFGDSTPQQPKS